MSTQAKHTPGPWRTTKGARPTRPDVIADCGLICSLEYGPDDGTANAHLIAAAPDMLEALRVTLHRAEQARHSSEQLGPIAAEWLDGIISEARAAIAKAEGRAGE